MLSRSDRATPLGRNRIVDFLWRHLPLLVLLGLLGVHGTRTFGMFVVSDDLRWIGRTVADAARPWNAFGASLFGSYYRPIPQLVWLVNYYLWGLNFEGHQLMLILMWLGGVAAVYAVGCRIGGRGCGTVAAAIVGLNDIYLKLVGWKSWYTTLTEFVLVMGWAWFFLRWVESRRRGDLIGWVALGVLAVLSRELAPLIISAGVLVTVVWPLFVRATEARARRRAWGWLGVWAAVTLVVALGLPSYRSAVVGVLSSNGGGGGGSGEARAVWAGYFVHHFREHTRSILSYGILRYLLLFAVLFSVVRGMRGRLGKRHRTVFLGAYLVVAVVLGVPWGARNFGDPAAQIARAYMEPACAALLLGLFVSAALRGDRWDRLLGAWFVVSFVPILFLKHCSFAYHTLALAALALYVGREAAAFAAEELPWIVGRMRGRVTAGSADEARFVTGGVFALVLLVQAVMLNANWWQMGKLIARDRKMGRTMAAAVERTIERALMSAGAERRVWVGDEGYGWLAGLMLQEDHGFRMARLDGAEGERIGLRDFDSPFRVYTDVIRYDRAVFERHNLLRDGGFERGTAGVPRARRSRTGKYAAVARDCGVRPVIGPFGLHAGRGYVFGGFLRREARGSGRAGMALVSVAGKRFARRTVPVSRRAARWELVWECAAPQVQGRRFEFRVVDVEGRVGGAIYADDVFLCPVEPLIAMARGEGK